MGDSNNNGNLAEGARSLIPVNDVGPTLFEKCYDKASTSLSVYIPSDAHNVLER